MRAPLLLSVLFGIACAAESKTAAEAAVDSGTDSADIPVGPSFVEDAADGLSVAAVDPERYLGVWYEIASSPSFQQSSCAGTTAEYSLRDDGDVRVINRCYIGSLDGALNEIEGKASFLDDTYARLLVDFGFGFTAPYTIVELDGDESSDPYSFAVVTSAGVALWVLSRTPQMDEDLYDTLVTRAAARGYPADTLIRTAQPE